MELEDRNSLTDSCDFDAVAVYDGNSETDVLLGRWCGGKSPPPLTSRANKLLVVLNTDRTVAFKGFSAAYTGGECPRVVTAPYAIFHFLTKHERKVLLKKVTFDRAAAPRCVCSVFYLRLSGSSERELH